LVLQPSFWQQKNSPQKPFADSAPWVAQCDVAVVGGGLTGLSAAYWLAREGVDVCLLERAPHPGCGATGRSAGQINPIGPELPDQLTLSLGTEATQALFRMLWHSKELVCEVVSREAIDCELQRVPFAHLARRPAEWAQLQRALPDYRALGREPRALPAQAPFLGGIELPGHLRLDPWLLAQGMAEAISRLGGRLQLGVSMLGVSNADGGGLQISTSAGPLCCEFVIHATGQALTDEAVFPVRGQMLWTQPAPVGILANCISNGGYDYWHQRSDGRLLIGGMRYLEPEMECGLTDTTLNPKIGAALLDFLHSAYPELGPLEQAGSWCGIMAHTADDLPLIGSLPGHARQLVAAGMCGHGLAYGMATGQALAARITGRDVDYPWALFSPRRFL